MKWRVEALFRTKMGQQQWVRFAGPFDTRDEAERAMQFARGLAAWGPEFGDPLLSLAGWRLVPVDIEPSCDAGKVPALAKALSAIAQQTTPDSAGGASITDSEMLAMAGDVEAAFAALEELRHRVHQLQISRRAS